MEALDRKTSDLIRAAGAMIRTRYASGFIM